MPNCSRPRRSRASSLESLELRLSPTSLPVHGVIVPLPEVAQHLVSWVPTNDLGDDPPITQPELPPTGPVGPGSSS